MIISVIDIINIAIDIVIIIIIIERLFAPPFCDFSSTALNIAYNKYAALYNNISI